MEILHEALQWNHHMIYEHMPLLYLENRSYCNRNIINQAFAKLHGSYASIRGGMAYEAMMDLTGE